MKNIFTKISLNLRNMLNNGHDTHANVNFANLF